MALACLQFIRLALHSFMLAAAGVEQFSGFPDNSTHRVRSSACGRHAGDGLCFQGHGNHGLCFWTFPWLHDRRSHGLAMRRGVAGGPRHHPVKLRLAPQALASTFFQCCKHAHIGAYDFFRPRVSAHSFR